MTPFPEAGLLEVDPRTLTSTWRPLADRGGRFFARPHSAFAVRPEPRGWLVSGGRDRLLVNHAWTRESRLFPEDVISDDRPDGRLFLFQQRRAERDSAVEATVGPDAADEAFLVYADWLQDRGDPLGATILQCHQFGRSSAFPRFLLGHQLKRLKMRFCFWVDVEVDAGSVEWAQLIAALLLFPRGRFLRSLKVDVPDDDAGAWHAAILRARPPTLRALTVGPLRWDG